MKLKRGHSCGPQSNVTSVLNKIQPIMWPVVDTIATLPRASLVQVAPNLQLGECCLMMIQTALLLILVSGQVGTTSIYRLGPPPDRSQVSCLKLALTLWHTLYSRTCTKIHAEASLQLKLHLCLAWFSNPILLPSLLLC